MASIRKLQSGNFQVQIRRTNFPNVNQTFSRKRDATEFVRQVEGNSELLQKLGKACSDIPNFQQLCDLYIAEYKGKDPSTLGRLNWWVKQFGEMPVTKIDEFHVDEALNKLAAKQLTGSTINRYKSTLSATLIFFIRHPLYKRAGFTNPVRKESVTRFSENPGKDRFLSAQEQKLLLAACRQSHWPKLYLLVLMALTTGARKGELLSLKWGDCDLSQRSAILYATKNGKARQLPLTQPVIIELVRFRGNPAELVFPALYTKNTETRQKSSQHQLITRAFDSKKAWNTALREARIDYCRFHDLRHSAASNLVKAGRTLFEVSVLLGHSNIQMTQRYSHLAIHDTRLMVDSVMGDLS